MIIHGQLLNPFSGEICVAFRGNPERFFQKSSGDNETFS
jgi:hypothetical protein